jgi:hypothetical protein
MKKSRQPIFFKNKTKQNNKQTSKTEFVRGSQENSMRNFHNHHNFNSDQASKQVYMIFSAKYNAKHCYGSGILPEDLFFVLEPSMIAVENKSS